MFKKLGVLIAIAVFIALLCGCSANTQLPSSKNSAQPATQNPDYNSAMSITQKPTIKLVITTDFGKEVLLEQEVEIEQNTSAMDALKKVAEVKTKYGGGFVDAINDISSKTINDAKNDWFFFINGISSNVGANDYILHNGDIEHWDFRAWIFHQFVPAIIGDFPQPFLNGYKAKVKPTVIAHEEWLEAHALSLVNKLKGLGVKDVSLQDCSQLPENNRGQCNLILLANKDNKLVSEVSNAYAKLGFYTYFKQENLVTLDAKGEIASEHGSGCGLIQATQNPWNPRGIGTGENVVWLISGTDEAGIKSAVDALLNSETELKYSYTVITEGKKVIKVP